MGGIFQYGLDIGYILLFENIWYNIENSENV